MGKEQDTSGTCVKRHQCVTQMQEREGGVPPRALSREFRNCPNHGDSMPELVPPHTHNQHNRLQTLPTQQPHHFMSTTTASAAGSASADASGGGANLSLHTPSL
eukprot:scaffold3982_cov273-Alexandrium_tamarense.AAC.1